MKAIKEGHFGFIVGDIPVGTSDHATWGQVNDVSNQLNAGCVQEKRLGGIQRAGKSPDIVIMVNTNTVNPIDRSKSQSGRHNIRTGSVLPVAIHPLWDKFLCGAWKAPACTSTWSNCLGLLGSFVIFGR